MQGYQMYKQSLIKYLQGNLIQPGSRSLSLITVLFKKVHSSYLVVLFSPYELMDCKRGNRTSIT